MTKTSADTKEQAKQATSTAAEKAGEVARTTREAAGEVVEDARGQADEIRGELKGQARELVDETRTQLRTQAETQTSNAADSLARLAEQLRALRNGEPDEAGSAVRYIDLASDTIADAASRLRSRNFEGLVQDVERFARRRPGTFLAIAAATGFVAGRVARSTTDEVREFEQARRDSATGEPGTGRSAS